MDFYTKRHKLLLFQIFFFSSGLDCCNLENYIKTF